MFGRVKSAFSPVKSWYTALRSNRSLVSAAVGAYDGVSGAYKSGVGGASLRDLAMGTWGSNGRWAAAGGAAIGAGAGAVAGGRDHRVSGAVGGGLLGAGAGMGGAMAYNNRRGLLNMAKGGRRGAWRGAQKLDSEISDLRGNLDYEL